MACRPEVPAVAAWAACPAAASAVSAAGTHGHPATSYDGVGSPLHGALGPDILAGNC